MFSFTRLESMLDFRLFRNVLTFMVGVCLLAIPFDVFFVGRISQVNKPAAADTTAAVQDNIPSFESVSSYESSFQKSSLFGLSSPDGNISVFKSSIAELIKDYRLKGVVILDEPEAIIQDARSQKSVFVKPGDKLGELTVKEIKEGLVVFSYFGEVKEVRMQ